MIYRRPLSSLAWLCLVATALWAEGIAPKPSLGEPAISPDGSEIAFVSGGDIWTVPARGGEARLLVAHPATESRPLYSPDGRMLAFGSTRTGNGDIYVLTFATGELTRLTWSDAAEQPDGWSPDGKWIYFTSSANDIGHLNDIFRVSVEGGTPLEVSRERYLNEFESAPSPDGDAIALVARGISSSQWWRNGHSHIDETEIWVKPVSESGGYRRVIGGPSKQAWPMWGGDGKTLFYMSDRGGTENVWSQPAVAGGAARQLTHFTEGRVLWPSIGHQGKEIVFERGFAIWKMDTKTGKAAPVEIRLRGAPAGPTVKHEAIPEFTGLTVSPDGKKLAIVAHGEVFAASAKDGGVAQRVTHTAAEESGIRWSRGSKRIVYVSERNGHRQLFEYDFAKDSERQLTNTSAEDEVPEYSPDGKMLSFVRNEKEVHVLTIDGLADRVVATDMLWDPATAWSPDSQWVAFASYGAKSFRNVNVVAAAGGEVHPVSFLANGETASRIAWAPDGKYLLFETAQRSETPQMARVDLLPRVPRYREDEFKKLFEPEKTAPEKTGSSETAEAKPKEAAPEKTQPVKIVFDGIDRRLTLLPIGLDVQAPEISPDGKTLLFAASAAGQRNLYTYSLDELAKEPAVARQLTSTAGNKSDYQFSPDSKEVFFLDKGHVVTIPLESRVAKPVAVTAEMDVDFDQDKEVAFAEAWSVLNRRFYDSSFNGHDWAELRDQYAPYVAGSRNQDEMRRVIGLMIGDLNSSHSGIGGPPANPGAPVGRLGLRFEREPYEAGKGLVIREVIELGPAAIEGTIKPGETLLAVNGAAVGPHINLDRLLENEVDRRVVLEVGSAGDAAKKRDVVVRPIAATAETGLLYRQWVNANRAYVDKISGGKLGYIHLPDMGQQSLQQLYVDLDARNENKQGVVVDIRNNNGGFINGYAIDVFARKNYLIMTPRGLPAAPARPFLGQRALGLPTVLITNESSLSDAEDFTEGYRALKLGKVVGEPTAGWIIYTSGQRLIDGSVVREPEIRVQDLSGQTMEMHPRPVDVEVQRMLGDSDEGRDAQLDRAVRVLLDGK